MGLFHKIYLHFGIKIVKKCLLFPMAPNGDNSYLRLVLSVPFAKSGAKCRFFSSTFGVLGRNDKAALGEFMGIASQNSVNIAAPLTERVHLFI